MLGRMHKPTLRAFALAPLVFTAACAVDPSPPPPDESAAQTDAVQRYIDAIYHHDDVRHSFRSKLGDDVDCVAFEAEPGVRALLAAGATLDEVRRSLAEGRAATPSSGAGANDMYLAGDPDEVGRQRACPDGTVPHVRLTRARIAAAGGLDAYERIVQRKQPKSAPMNPTSGGKEAHTGPYAWVFANYKAASQGGTSTMTIAAPTLPGNGIGDHSIAQVWVSAGGGTTGQPLQTVEAGWIALPCGQTGPCAPRLFIYSTPDSYATGCYNGGAPSSGCVTWVPNPSATLMLNAPLTASTPGGAQHELTITVRHARTLHCFATNLCTFFWGRWDVYASTDGAAPQYLGYYANSAYGSGPLASGSTEFEIGGEVYDSNGTSTEPSPPRVTMGEGGLFLGLAQYGYTAYHRDFAYYTPAFALQGDGSTAYYTADAYIYNVTAPAGSSSWKNWFYFGDWVGLNKL